MVTPLASLLTAPPGSSGMFVSTSTTDLEGVGYSPLVSSPTAAIRALSSSTAAASTCGVGKTESSDVTYATPFFYLVPCIKANGFSNVHLGPANCLGICRHQCIFIVPCTIYFPRSSKDLCRPTMLRTIIYTRPGPFRQFSVEDDSL